MPGADGKVRQLHVPGEKFEKSVHGAFQCTMCHQDITAVPHSDKHQKVDCGICHADQKKAYLTSVHAQEQAKGNTGAATCVSCHTNHEIVSPKTDAAKLAIVQRCGTCHKENLQSYADTYHGQVNALGFTYTAKCFDCHGNHGIKRVSDPDSTVHPYHRLQTCQKCHDNATWGFVTFHPHANTHDYERYPLMWIVSKFMLVLIIGVFAFFWTHSALWFYREFKDRKQGIARPHIAAADVPQAQGQVLSEVRSRVAACPPRICLEPDDLVADGHGGVLRQDRVGRRPHASAGRPAVGSNNSPYRRRHHSQHIPGAAHLLRDPPGAALEDVRMVRA